MRLSRLVLGGFGTSLALFGLLVGCGSSDTNTPLISGNSGGASLRGGSGGGGAGPSGWGGQTTMGSGGSVVIISHGGVTASSGGTDTGGMTAAGGRMVTEKCASTQASSTDETKVLPADIIFAIDSSGSMDEEIEFVQEQMNDFSQQIIASGIDVRVILIGDRNAICIGAPLGSGSCPNDSKMPNYIHIPTEVGSNDALNLYISTFPQWRQYLRPEATKSFVVVTDDDATDTPNNSAARFRTNVAALDATLFKSWTFNGVYCFSECPDAAAVGEVYIDLVAETMGVGGDLCLQDFQPVFSRLAEKIITTSGTKISCEWAFPQPPAGQTFSSDLVTVNRTTTAGTTPLTRVNSKAECSKGAWYFDSTLNPSKVLACEETCSDIQNQTGGKIDVVYGCESVGSCVASGSAMVSGGAGSCQWTLPPPPMGQQLDFTSVNVRYTSPSGFATPLGVVSDAGMCSGVAHGWHYDDAAMPTKIIACPQTCSEIEAGGTTAKVEVLFGCKSRPADPIIVR